MKKITKILILSPFFLATASGLTSCGSEDLVEKVTLKVINSEDYIYLDDEDPSNNMTEQFKRYVKQLAIDGEIDSKYKYVDVVYDTSDTNETLYSELQTGKSDYDLINVSDYMAQKMVSEGLVIPLLQEGEIREEKIPNYVNYASETLRGRLDNIEAPIYSEWVDDPINPGEKVHPYVRLEDYAVGYMWGTLGILVNPEYSGFSTLELDEIIDDMHYSFSALWNPKYNGSISIKNSMRDTFAAGLMHAYEEDFASIKEEYEEALEAAGEDESLIALAKEKYMSDYAKIFNGENEEKFSTVVSNVQNSLDTLKSNIFGLEVDSGKQDIVTRKIGINLAWSGDAVYAMDQAEDTELVGKGNESELYYCVPELGSNLWFDTWVMPKNNNRSEERRELALMFLDFMSDPANAMQNMDYTGYTSFIGGEDIVDLARDWFDVRAEEVVETVEDESYEVYAAKAGDFFKVDYSHCLSTGHKDDCEDYSLYYFVPYYDTSSIKITYVEEPRTFAELVMQKHLVYVKDEETGKPTKTPKKYGDLVIADEEYDEVDLSYFFNGTFDDDSEYKDNIDTIFYSDGYYADVECTHDEETHANYSVGRQFFTQYPDEETITRCAVMKDFGENNKLVMKMWEEFKSDPLPTSSLVLFIVIIAAGAALGGYFIANKVIQKNIRKKRKAREQK